MCSLLQLPNKVICNYNKASLWEERRRDIGFLGELVIRCNALLAVSTYFYLLAASVKWPGGLSPGQREALSQLLCWQSREAGVSSAAGTRSLRGSWSSVARQGTPQRQVCEECYPLAFQVRHAFFCCFCFVFLTLREAAIARMLFSFSCLYCFSQVLNPFLCWNTPRYPAVSYWVHLCYSIPAECASSPRGSWTFFSQRISTWFLSFLLS